MEKVLSPWRIKIYSLGALIWSLPQPRQNRWAVCPSATSVSWITAWPSPTCCVASVKGTSPLPHHRRLRREHRPRLSWASQIDLDSQLPPTSKQLRFQGKLRRIRSWHLASSFYFSMITLVAAPGDGLISASSEARFSKSTHICPGQKQKEMNTALTQTQMHFLSPFNFLSIPEWLWETVEERITENSLTFN